MQRSYIKLRGLSRTLASEASLKRLFWLFSFILTLFLGFYMYFVCLSILHTVTREQLQSDIAQAHSTVGELEAVYLSQKETLDLSHAPTLGLVQLIDKRFVARKSLSVGLISLRE